MVKTEAENKILAWHFVRNTLRDGRPIPPDNEPLYQDDPIVLCKRGLHGSERLIDALFHAPGHILCRTEHSGTIVKGDNKLASSVRTILWRIDATDVLRSFARRCALDVAHLWVMPTIVRQYLETGDETLREEAKRASRINNSWAASAATWSAVRIGMKDAAWNAAWCAVSEITPDSKLNLRVDLVLKYNDLLTSMIEAEHEKQKENSR